MARIWCWIGLAAQVLFPIAWLVAQLWQRPTYSSVEHTISDMYAYGAPHPAFLLVVLTLTGAATIGFAVLGLRPALSGHWTGTVGWILVAVSILGLGDLLTFAEREGCQLAAPGCEEAAQTANAGGALDAGLSTFGILALGAAGLFIAAALQRRPSLARYAWPSRIGGILVFVLLLGQAGFTAAGIGGLGERILAVAVCAGVGALAVIVRDEPALEADRG